jgi:site-specific DNA recombinase
VGKSAVRAILINPRYTGFQVWNKQRKDEILLDVNDVASGHQTVMRWNKKGDWVWSPEPAHEAIVSKETFEQVQSIIASKSRPTGPRKPRPTQRAYALNGRLLCELCGRRLHGSWNHGEAYYRCSYAKEYAASKKIDHPRTVYLRERDFLPRLDQWLVELFEADNLEALSARIAQGSEEDLRRSGEITVLERTLAECRTKINRYREALEAGTDPALVTGWIAETTAAQAQAESRLRELKRNDNKLTEEQIAEALAEVGGLVGVLAHGSSEDRAKFYEEINLEATYDPHQRTVEVSAETRVRMVRVGERT